MAVSGSEPRTRRRAGNREALESAGMMRWLLTYADMITLLLALFIILFAISTISRVKFNRLAQEISGGFSSTDAVNNPPNGGTTGAQHGRTDEANMASVKAQLDEYIAQQNIQSKVQTRIDKQGLTITLLSDKTYYDSGSAELRPETKQLLDVVAGQLRGVRNDVRVEGSTDNVPIATAEYPTNWELSAARATGVTRYLVEHDKIVPTRISFAGFGEFRPKFPNDTDAHRQQNRRVDIVILNGPTKQSSANESSSNGDGPSAAASTPNRNLVARSDGGPHATRGGRAAGGGAPLK
ncbi:MAG TPA: OmpA family protein [Candidatus Elarobacter sp.]|nr:OmpA family protein [Candidatus Elarobacter sp.]